MTSCPLFARAALSCTLASLVGAHAFAGGSVLDQQKIGELDGGFVGTFAFQDRFASSTAQIGDLNNDGIEDVAVGLPGFDGAGANQGAVWVLFLNADGTIKNQHRITTGESGFTGVLDAGDRFGRALTALDDINADGRADLIVGAPGDDDGGADRGAVWVLFLSANGTVQSHQKISSTAGGFNGVLDDGDGFGTSLANVGDLNGDGLADLGAGAVGDDDGATDAGAVWLLRMGTTGITTSTQKLSALSGNFGGALDAVDHFGSALVSLGDLDGNGAKDLAVGAELDDDGGSFGFLSNVGAVWVLFMAPGGVAASVVSEVKLSATTGISGLANQDRFGTSLATVVDGAGNLQLAVGAPSGVSGSATNPSGKVLLLDLASDATVTASTTIAAATGGFGGTLATGDQFGGAVATLPDFDGDGRVELAVGAPGDAGTGPAGSEHGALWLLFLDVLPDALVAPYGCDVNPPQSLAVLAGEPAVGGAMTMGVDNPLGTQAAGSLSVVVIATSPDAAFPCGTPLPGFGMAGGGADGELLINLAPFPPSGLIQFGPLWSGPGVPAEIPIPIPANPGLIGAELYLQGALIDPPPSDVEIGLTNALRIVIGA